VRLELLCGKRAYDYVATVAEQNKQISGLLSARPMETAAAAARLQQELNDTKYRMGQMEDKLFAQKAETLRDAGDVLLFEEGLKPDSLRRLADAVQKVCGGRAAVFSKTAEGYQYAIGQENGDLRAFTKELNSKLNGRGGGKPVFQQGRVQTKKAEIEAFFAER
jgi:alanyl-tRNA synthetase